MRIGRLLALTGLVFFADQLSKWWVVRHMELDRLQHIEIAPPWLNFTMAWNKGVNFGVLASESFWSKAGLAAFAAAAAAAVLVWARRSNDALFGWGAALLAGGALGNAVDRLAHGAVADFLNVSCCGIVNPFAFNLADVGVFLGALLLVARSGGGARKERSQNAEGPP